MGTDNDHPRNHHNNDSCMVPQHQQPTMSPAAAVSLRSHVQPKLELLANHPSIPSDPWNYPMSLLPLLRGQWVVARPSAHLLMQTATARRTADCIVHLANPISHRNKTAAVILIIRSPLPTHRKEDAFLANRHPLSLACHTYSPSAIVSVFPLVCVCVVDLFCWGFLISSFWIEGWEDERPPLESHLYFQFGRKSCSSTQKGISFGIKGIFLFDRENFQGWEQRIASAVQRTIYFPPFPSLFLCLYCFVCPAKFVKVSIPGADMETHHGLLSFFLLVFPFSCVLVSNHVFSLCRFVFLLLVAPGHSKLVEISN